MDAQIVITNTTQTQTKEREKIMKKFMVTALAIMGMMSTANAQDTVEGTVSADIVSRYIWRGQALSDAAIQPSAGLSYKGFSLSGWASIGIVSPGSENKEYDLTLSYSTGGLNIGVTDYYFSTPGAANEYFEYRAHHTQHTFEANVGYDFGPLAIQWYTNFAGADGVNKSGKRAYSSYFSISAPFKLATCDWQATFGAVPYATSFYSDATGFAVTNLSLRCTKEIPVTKNWGIPVFLEGICNPSTKKGYIVAGVTFALPE